MRYLTIDTQSSVPVYLQIIEQIRGRIGDGGLPPNAPLPSVRQMASDLGINPNTVAKAYLLLEREGLILTVQRRGTFVAEAAPTRAMESLDARVETAVDRILEETAAIGVDRGRLLEALRRRLLDKIPESRELPETGELPESRELPQSPEIPESQETGGMES